jgi:hypothetical protein
LEQRLSPNLSKYYDNAERSAESCGMGTRGWPLLVARDGRRAALALVAATGVTGQRFSRSNLPIIKKKNALILFLHRKNYI